ncbi:uncharacterized protein MONBRDRAFT_23873 [Monosiga brevicollis MX1]|uniref:Centrosomal protein of 44 kDa n=1 Tax=Monosiga brevicollis TaxID=81824 RepID=A9UV36_MONBE|nr:uncharacterized protein MONBRDRAFT_23873 [Monosiga brevicollis MX1]EDQ90826.1 predicted protein [Monosiga brevicollis MX1]|eukprot:XP_001744123.1 hypothetical protein [Monosiga brevicollis MX1]
MSTGDLLNNLGRLQRALRVVRYAGHFDTTRAKLGDPAAFLPLIHYTLLAYSHRVSAELAEHGYELYGKSDLRFVEAVFRLLRNEFGYSPRLSTEQFFARGFAELKMILVVDITDICIKRHRELARQAKAELGPRGSTRVENVYGPLVTDNVSPNTSMLYGARRQYDSQLYQTTTNHPLDRDDVDSIHAALFDVDDSDIQPRSPLQSGLPEQLEQTQPTQNSMPASVQAAATAEHSSATHQAATAAMQGVDALARRVQALTARMSNLDGKQAQLMHLASSHRSQGEANESTNSAPPRPRPASPHPTPETNAAWSSELASMRQAMEALSRQVESLAAGMRRMETDVGTRLVLLEAQVASGPNSQQPVNDRRGADAAGPISPPPATLAGTSLATGSRLHTGAAPMASSRAPAAASRSPVTGTTTATTVRAEERAAQAAEPPTTLRATISERQHLTPFAFLARGGPLSE